MCGVRLSALSGLAACSRVLERVGVSGGVVECREVFDLPWQRGVGTHPEDRAAERDLRGDIDTVLRTMDNSTGEKTTENRMKEHDGGKLEGKERENVRIKEMETEGKRQQEEEKDVEDDEDDWTKLEFQESSITNSKEQTASEDTDCELYTPQDGSADQSFSSTSPPYRQTQHQETSQNSSQQASSANSSAIPMYRVPNFAQSCINMMVRRKDWRNLTVLDLEGNYIMKIQPYFVSFLITFLQAVAVLFDFFCVIMF